MLSIRMAAMILVVVPDMIGLDAVVGLELTIQQQVIELIRNVISWPNDLVGELTSCC